MGGRIEGPGIGVHAPPGEPVGGTVDVMLIGVDHRYAVADVGVDGDPIDAWTENSRRDDAVRSGDDGSVRRDHAPDLLCVVPVHVRENVGRSTAIEDLELR